MASWPMAWGSPAGISRFDVGSETTAEPTAKPLDFRCFIFRSLFLTGQDPELNSYLETTPH